MPDPYLYAYNCSSDPMSSVWQYNASSSPSQRQALSYRLQNAMCAEFLGASSCPSTGPVPPDPSSFDQKSGSDFNAAAFRSFCEIYHIDKVSVLLYTIFASPAFAVFLVNAAVLALQYARKRRSRSLCTAEEAATADRSVGSVLGSLDAIEMHLNVPRSPEGNRSTPPSQQLGAINAASANLYGAFAFVLSLCCLRWTVGASHERGRQLSRAFFSTFFLCFTAIICRSNIAVFSSSGIVASSKVGAFFYQTQCSYVNPNPSRPLQECSNLDQALYNFIQCAASGKLTITYNSGAVLVIFLQMLPVHSLFCCAWFWPHTSNPVALALYTLRQLQPQMHSRICLVVVAVFTATFALIFVAVCFLSQSVVFDFNSANGSKFVALDSFLGNPANSTPLLSCFGSQPLLNFRAACNFLMLLFVLPPLLMVAAHAFIALLIRARMSAFNSLVHAAYSVQRPGSSDAKAILRSLVICSCPQNLLDEWQSLIHSEAIDGGGCSVDALLWLRGRLQLLWLEQMRLSQDLVKHFAGWHVWQTLFLVVVIIPVALYLLALTNLQMNQELRTSLLSFLVLGLFAYLLPVLAAILCLAFGHYFIDCACDNVTDLLRECGSKATQSSEVYLQTFGHGNESLSALAVFCPIMLRDAIRMGPVPIDFPTLFKFVYQLGIGVGLLITFFSNVLQQ